MKRICVIICSLLFVASIPEAQASKDREFTKNVYDSVAKGDMKALKKLEDSEDGVRIQLMEELICTAARTGQLEMVKYLNEKYKFPLNKNIGKMSRGPIILCAADSGQTEVIDYLLSRGVDIKSKDENGNNIILRSGNLEILKKLTSRYGDKIGLNERNARGDNILLATNCNNIEQIKYLIDDQKMDVNAKNLNGETLLHRCSRHPKVYKYLIEEKKVDINAPDNFGRTALHRAIWDGDTDKIEYYVEHGAKADALTKDGENLLHVAASANKDDVVEFLVEKYKMDVNAKDAKGNTPLHHLLVHNPNLKSCKFLIDNGADPNAVNNEGETPLYAAMNAAHYKSKVIDVAKYLVSKGADPKIRTKKKKTAMDHAILAGGRRDLLEYLNSVTN